MSADEITALQSDLVVGSDAVRLVLKGQIDEGADLDPLAKRLTHAISKQPAARAVIDTFDVQRINSCGVREWINFMRSIDAIPSVVLARCSPAIVVQLNSVFNFRGRASIESIVAPFFCASCDQEQLDVVNVPAHVQDPAELLKEKHVCNQCGKPVQFDDIVERYFMFVKFRGAS